MRSHLDLIHEQPCIVCGQRPVSAHHVVGGSIFVRIGPRGRRKHSNFLCLPLCHDHHQGMQGVHTIGVSTWETVYGFQSHMIDRLGLILGMDLWKAAQRERDEKQAAKKYKPGSKIMKRRNT